MEKDVEIQSYIDSSGMFWQDTCDFLTQRCTEVFDNIPNTIIKSDLVHAGQAHCGDLIEQNRIKTRQAIQLKLRKAINDKQVCLKKIGLSDEDFALNIESVAEGVMLSNSIDTPVQAMQTTLRIYEIASAVG